MHVKETEGSKWCLIANGQSTGEVRSMTESQREEIIEGMFPDWREHLNDGKVIDHILDGLSCREIVLNRCSRPGCYNVARRGLKRCTQCAAKAAQYMRIYQRRKTPHREPRSVMPTSGYLSQRAGTRQ
jgi:hypothetical protein